MYADREPRPARRVQIEYRSNAAEFGMGRHRQRSRSPVRAAVARSGDCLFLNVIPYCRLVRSGASGEAIWCVFADGVGETEVARRVYVGNLAYSVAWQDLKDHFKPVGQGTSGDLQQ